ncbi:hypothetical protein NLM24_15355 [Nocardia zapadnayensis]|uniref:hypothetical protein n=1 Tax=Nocardia rhamnosiphila TaxID=426716 RepID=UPI0022484750|nr:hypothetical protein [Nocardia zapadnayensis]MCX0272059.1 hypothetical protein [Nocardia zapadnayensis]
MGTAPALTPERTSTRSPAAFPAHARAVLANRLRAPGVTVLWVAAGLIAAQLAVRTWVTAHGYFYWDDLILAGRAGTLPLLSGDLLLHDHDGHFMPLAFAVSWLVTTMAPLNWGVTAAVLLAGQLAASLAVLRMLLVLLGRRRALLIPLAFYLFSPLTLPAFAWWSAALNALPLQFALAWVVGDAVLLDRTGRRRYAISGVLVTTVGLLFFEKAVVVPFVAFAVVLLRRYVDGRRPAVPEVLRRGAGLWAGAAAVLALWAVFYLVAVGLSRGEGGSADLAHMLPRAAWAGVVTALLGGPWGWERWVPSAPWAVAPGWAVWAAWALLAAGILLTVRARRVVWPVWVAAVAYVPAVQIPVVLMRAGPNTVDELMMSLRYLADAAVVLTTAGALILRAFARGRAADGAPRGHATGDSRWRGPLPAIVVVAVFALSSLWSTYTFTRSWSEGPTKAYVTTVKSEFAQWDGAPLLAQEVPWTVLNPTAYPENEASRVLSSIAPPGAFAAATDRLRMITDSGEFADARVWWNRGIPPGPEPGCGYRIGGDLPVRVPLDGPMIAHEWTAQLNYFADRDATLTVGLERGDRVEAPVRAGLNTVYVRIVGSGSALIIRNGTPGSVVCLGTGPVGVASYS